MKPAQLADWLERMLAAGQKNAAQQHADRDERNAYLVGWLQSGIGNAARILRESEPKPKAARRWLKCCNRKHHEPAVVCEKCGKQLLWHLVQSAPPPLKVVK